MKKYFIIFLLLFTFVISSCKKSNNNTSDPDTSIEDDNKENNENNNNNNNENNTQQKIEFDNRFIYNYLDTEYFLEANSYQLKFDDIPEEIDGVVVNKIDCFLTYLSSFEYIITEYNNCKYIGYNKEPYLILSEVIDKTASNVIIEESTKYIDEGAFNGCGNIQELTLPKNLEGISYNAFNNCNIQKINLPDRWSTILNNGYSDEQRSVISMIKTILYPYYLEGKKFPIQGYKYTDVNNCQYFGPINNPFYLLYSVIKDNSTSLIIHDDTFVVYSTLEYGNNIENISISKNVKYISSLFNYFKGNITIDTNNSSYKVVDGALYTKDDKILLYYPIVKDSKTILLPEGLEQIYSCSFRNLIENLTVEEIIIPKSVKHIGKYAFSEVSSLKTIIIPDGVKILNNILPSNISNCSIYLGSGICQSNLNAYYQEFMEYYYKGTIYDFCKINAITPILSFNYDFYYLDEKNSYVKAENIDFTIPKEIDYINSDFFLHWNFLQSINLHENIKEIEVGAFAYLDNLQYNEYENGCYLGYESNPYAVFVKVKDSSLSPFKMHDDTTYILDGAFYGCEKLEKVVIPSNVSKINQYPFIACSNLKEIIFENNNNIVQFGGDLVVLAPNQTAITNLYLPKYIKGLLNINGYLYDNVYYNGKLDDFFNQEVNKNTYYQRLEQLNFYSLDDNNQYSLLVDFDLSVNINKIGINEINLMKHVNEIVITPNIAYIHYIPLKSLYVPSTVLETYYGSSILYFESYNPNVLLIDEDNFSIYFTPYYVGITKDNVVNINNIEYVLNNDLTATLACYKGNDSNVVIPSQIEVNNKTYIVTKIGSYSFRNSANIHSIEIPSTVEIVQNYSFVGLQCNIYCNQRGKYENEDNWYSDSVSNIQFLNIHHKNSYESKIIDDIQYEIINSTDVEVVNYFGQDRQVRLPEQVTINSNTYKVTRIGNNAFSYNNIIEEIQLGQNITEIGSNSFIECKNLKTININNIIEIGNHAFDNCINLNIPEINNKELIIGKYAFYNCRMIKEINVGKISTKSFEGCTNLEKAIINNNLHQYKAAFKDCINLKTVIFYGDVKYISSHAFDNCVNLVEVELPDTVNYIEDYAFSNCTSLQNFTINENIFNISETAFLNCLNLTISTNSLTMFERYNETFKKEFCITSKYDPEWFHNIIIFMSYTRHKIILK